MKTSLSFTCRRALPSIAVALCLFAAACGNDAPSGVSRSDLEGIWSGDLNSATLMGRTLSGSVDWIFSGSTYEIRFFDPPEGQAERISGTWKFSGGRLVLTLGSSFPIGDDIGATDTAFVSILATDLSMKTQGGSDIVLRLSARSTVDRTITHPSARRADGLYACLPRVGFAGRRRFSSPS